MIKLCLVLAVILIGYFKTNDYTLSENKDSLKYNKVIVLDDGVYKTIDAKELVLTKKNLKALNKLEALDKALEEYVQGEKKKQRLANN